MKTDMKITTVQGRTYKYYSDFIARGTFAEAEDGTVKQISWSGYITNDLTVRKAISNAFGLSSFRK